MEITAHVTKITRLSLQENILCYNGKPVESFSLKEGIIQLIDFLKKFDTPVTLVAHNCRAFDAFYLIQSIDSVKMLNKLSEVVEGFIDTLPLFRTLLPGMKKYSLFYMMHLLDMATKLIMQWPIAKRYVIQ